MPRIKKEDIFYTLLKQLTDVLVAAGEEYVNIFSGYPDTLARIPSTSTSSAVTPTP